jgi:hypothetical protein
MNSPHDDLAGARIETRQMPIFSRDAQAVCLELGMILRDAQRLYDDGLMSFDPKASGSLDEMREAELVFLGTLVGAGCTRPVLRALLRGLERPYCYDIARIFYDWREGRWRMHAGENDPVGAFFGLLERLREREQRETLLAIRDWLDEALDLARDRTTLFSHERREPPAGFGEAGGAGSIAAR